MSDYSKLKTAGIPEEGASCISNAITESVDILGSDPTLKVHGKEEHQSSPLIEIDGKDGYMLLLTHQTGMYGPPSGQAMTSKSIEDTKKIFSRFKGCMKFIP
jgi:hypothetical protein